MSVIASGGFLFVLLLVMDVIYWNVGGPPAKDTRGMNDIEVLFYADGLEMARFGHSALCLGGFLLFLFLAMACFARASDERDAHDYRVWEWLSSSEGRRHRIMHGDITDAQSSAAASRLVSVFTKIVRLSASNGDDFLRVRTAELHAIVWRYLERARTGILLAESGMCEFTKELEGILEGERDRLAKLHTSGLSARGLEHLELRERSQRLAEEFRARRQADDELRDPFDGG